ncbi:hypothetical protein Ancab_031922 [Ancistrocladus abbreviatus]
MQITQRITYPLADQTCETHDDGGFQIGGPDQDGLYGGGDLARDGEDGGISPAPVECIRHSSTSHMIKHALMNQEDAVVVGVLEAQLVHEDTFQSGDGQNGLIQPEWAGPTRMGRSSLFSALASGEDEERAKMRRRRGSFR